MFEEQKLIIIYIIIAFNKKLINIIMNIIILFNYIQIVSQFVQKQFNLYLTLCPQSFTIALTTKTS